MILREKKTTELVLSSEESGELYTLLHSLWHHKKDLFSNEKSWETTVERIDALFNTLENARRHYVEIA